MIKKSFCILLGLLLLLVATQQASVTLPVPSQLIWKLNLSLTRLESLLSALRTPQQNKISIWQRVQLTKTYFNTVNLYLGKYSNTIVGSGNTVSGTKNLVVGNNNNIQGVGNWVFVNNFNGKIIGSGNLLLTNWRIELDKSQLILINPQLAISLISDSANANYRNKFGGNRQFCQFGNWASPNSNNYKYWANYYGYDNFVANFAKPITSAISSVFNMIGGQFRFPFQR